MKRWLKITFILLAQLILVLRSCEAGGSFSQSFKLTVTIPAIIGLNVPDPNAKINSQNTAVTLASNVFSNTEVDVSEISVVRDHQNIMLKTIVVR